MSAVEKFLKAAMAFAVVVSIEGCAAQRFHDQGMKLIESDHPEEGIALLERAQGTSGSKASMRSDWLDQRDRFIQKLFVEGERERATGHLDVAQQRYTRVLALDPYNEKAQAALSALALDGRQNEQLDTAAQLIRKGELESANQLIGRVLIENPDHERARQLRAQIQALVPKDSLNGASLNLRSRKPVTLQFRDANLKMVMEALSRATNLNIVFDKDVRNDLKVTIFVREAPIEEAIDLILTQTQTAKKVLGENSILIYPDTPAKARDYAELKIRRFNLVNADAKQVLGLVKSMTKTKESFIDEKTNSLVLRDTPQVIRLAEKLIASMDQPEPEVLLEVDVIEVRRNRMQQLGIDVPTSFGATYPNGLLINLLRGRLANYASNSQFSVTAQAQKTDADFNDLANPRIRVRNKEKAKFLVGDRLPLISTAAVPTVSATSPIYNTSVQYVEVGLKIEVEPTIYPDGDVAIKLNLEVSSNSGQNPDAARNGTIAYTISTRSVNTVLRLKDGQTEVIGGLIQNQDRSASSHIPGLGDVPILGRLFGSQTDTKNKTEILMSITPRIIRNNRQVEGELLEMWSGTENALHFNTKVTPQAAVVPPAAGTASRAGSASARLAPRGAAAPAGDSDAAAPSPGPALPAAARAKLGTAAAARLTERRPAEAAPGADPGADPGAVKPTQVLRAPSILGPSQASVGEQVGYSINASGLTAVGSTEMSIEYDTARLRFLGAARASIDGAEVTTTLDSAGQLRVRVDSKGGPIDLDGDLAELQFEVMQGDAGTTSIAIVRGTTLVDGVSQTLPLPEPAQLEIRAAAPP